jgi:signal transduction histidine kinase
VNVAELFGAHGEMGAQLRAFDWSRSELGRPESWPTSLRTIVGMVLGSRFPMLIWWGPNLIQIYNDGYRAILGDKHPRSVAAPGHQVWSEIWHIVGPMAEGILSGGPPTWNEHLLLPIQRKGFLEEAYFTFSYSPIPDDRGSVGGVLVTVQETTEEVQGARQLRTLRDLGAVGNGTGSPREACREAAGVLEANPADVPFALLYLAEADGRAATLAATAGVPRGSDAAVETIALDGSGAWPLAASAQARARLDVTDARLLGSLPGGPLASAAGRAVIVPLARNIEGYPYGFAVFGVSAARPFDEGYAGFLQLVADRIAASIAHARSLDDARARADALEELDRAKTAFFSNVSHEFRTPLTLMLGPTEEALASDARALAGENLEMLHRNELRLLKLVNALLDFARIEAGRVQARYQPTDLPAFTADLASMFRSAVERAGLTLDVRCPAAPEPIYVDRAMWEQIVMNLLSNALKFTFQGGITVTLAGTQSGVMLAIADTGIGMAPQDIAQLFQRFHRIEGARGRTHEGSGIGLAMVHELVRLHGGRVTATSTPSVGTTFTVELLSGTAHLPADQVTTADRPATPIIASMFTEEALHWLPLPEPADQAMPGQRPALGERVLVVDDNADMRAYLTRLLQHRWTVRAVPDVDAALAAVAEYPPDLILADVMMPGRDGLAFVRLLRDRPGAADIPVIVVSARAGEEARLEGLRSGADEYLVKPFSPRELLVRVESQLALARGRRERAELLAREREARLEAELQKQHLHDLFMQAPTLIAVLRGPDFIVELANEGVCRAWGRPQDTIVGRPLLDALPALHGQMFAPLLRDVYTTGRAREGPETPCRFDRADGSSELVYFNFVYSPFRGADGHVAGIFVIASDVTDQVKARHQLEGLRRASEGANRAKDEFLAMLGHELRNPLSPIVTALQLMKLRGDGADRERTVIERQVAHLTRLVDDLLDVSRIARGKVELKVELVEMADVVVKAIEMASPLLEQRGHALELDVPRGGLAVNGDATRLAQVVSNLLTNAAKYTPAGGRISIVAARHGDAVELRLRDNGIGISPDVMAHVFDLFVQERQGLDRAHGGLGLGLTIVRNLVQLHGGTVSAESDGMGKGSQFVVRLPIAAPQPAQAADDANASRPWPPGELGRRILVVDDNDDSAAMLAEALRLRGHDVRVAHDGPAALTVSAVFRPDVAFLDIGLPVMDGYELAVRLRQQPGLEALRLLALTGYGQESDGERSRAAGFDEHLVKPLDLRHLDRLLSVEGTGDGAGGDPPAASEARTSGTRSQSARR